MTENNKLDIPDYPDDVKSKVDEKDLLLRQTLLLEGIMLALQAGEEKQDTPRTFTCCHCGSTVTKQKRKSHAKTCFNWSESIGGLGHHYEH